MLENKIALISGGLGDIGRAVALQLGKQGARVAICDTVNEQSAKSILDSLQNEGCTQLHYTQTDVSSESQVSAWIDAVEQHWGITQIAVCNAGIVVSGSLNDLPAEEVHRQMDVNFWGSYHLAVQAGRRMKEAGVPGRIVFIGSWAAERPNARISSYCISKAAIRMLCKTLALEWAADQILVNEVAPGIVEGGLSKQNQQKDPALRQVHVSATPAHSLVSVGEVAQHVVMLCSFSEMNITGTTLLVDGGLSLTSKMTP
ncbi:MAG: SDR family NAD(P)-dependent oxidoreductase [Flavisolibacter sp.]